ncbi:MAG: hypothetical protein ACR2PT_14905 [Endozoicomonas sp.]
MMTSFMRSPLTICLGISAFLSLACSPDVLADTIQRKLTIKAGGKSYEVTHVVNENAHDDGTIHQVIYLLDIAQMPFANLFHQVTQTLSPPGEGESDWQITINNDQTFTVSGLLTAMTSESPGVSDTQNHLMGVHPALIPTSFPLNAVSDNLFFIQVGGPQLMQATIVDGQLQTLSGPLPGQTDTTFTLGAAFEESPLPPQGGGQVPEETPEETKDSEKQEPLGSGEEGVVPPPATDTPRDLEPTAEEGLPQRALTSDQKGATKDGPQANDEQQQLPDYEDDDDDLKSLAALPQQQLTPEPSEENEEGSPQPADAPDKEEPSEEASPAQQNPTDPQTGATEDRPLANGRPPQHLTGGDDEKEAGEILENLDGHLNQHGGDSFEEADEAGEEQDGDKADDEAGDQQAIVAPPQQPAAPNDKDSDKEESGEGEKSGSTGANSEIEVVEELQPEQDPEALQEPVVVGDGNHITGHPMPVLLGEMVPLPDGAHNGQGLGQQDTETGEGILKGGADN